MGLPDPKHFNFKLLLQRFQKKYGEEITRELLSQFLVDGTIKGDPVREKYKRGGGFVRSWGETRREPVYYVDGPVIDYIVPLAEVLRFEAEHPHAGQAAVDVDELEKLPSPTLPPSTTQSRADALAKILVEIVNEFKEKNNRTPQYQEVLNSLKRLCRDRKHHVIQEVSEGVIYWKSAKGKDKTTTIKQLQNRLTGIRVV